MAELTDPREMRKLLNRVANGRERVDGRQLSYTEFAFVSSIVNRVFRAGYALGWSGEDTMTALAYHALLGYERLTDDMLQDALLKPPAPLITKA